MWQYLLKRLLTLPIIVWIVVSIIFFVMRIIPGDPAVLIAGPFATPQQIEQLRVIFGLDKPVYLQYVSWLRALLRGDWGISFQTRSPVLPLLAERLPKTLQLTGLGLVISLLIGVPLGVTAAVKAHSIVDYFSTASAVFWLSIPAFWFALILQLLFAAKLRWLPISGSGAGMWTLDNLRHLVLPALAIGLPYAAQYLRFTRSALLEVLLQDYIKTAWSKGLPHRSVVYKHALRNALIPIITLLGLRIPWMIGGAVIIENIFAWPGMGSFVVQAIYNRDFHVVEGFMVILAALVVITNLVVDLLYVMINPLIRYE